MAERIKGLWQYRLLFVFLSALVGFVHLLPINPGPGQLPGPDLILLIALSWTVMRPEFVPLILLAVVFLVADLLLMRPPGLWTALAILGCEFIRSRRILIRNAPFFIEWLLVTGVIVAMTITNALVLSIFGVPQPRVGLTVIHMLYTIVCYPLVLILAGRAFGLRKSTGERESLGRSQ